MTSKLEQLREQFPELQETVYGKPLVYLDNAATSQRPLSVITKWTELSTRFNSNLHRAVHRIAELATIEYESTRDFVKDYIGAHDRSEIIFTSGATASLNLVASSYSEAFLKPGDEILIAESEHHSDIVPWQMASQRRGFTIKVLPVDDRGIISVSRLAEIMTDKTRLVCVAHISNVLGVINPIRELADVCHAHGAHLLCDGAQGIVHCKVDVEQLNCDFYLFSGHKVYAAPGTGVLYGRRELLDQMPPYMGGGEMIETVRWTGTSYAGLPQKFEAGTQNMAGTPTLKPALELAAEMFSDDIQSQLDQVRDYVMDQLTADSRICLYGVPDRREDKIPLFSFTVKGAHHEDLALIMDKMGFALRSGQMCAEPLMDRFGVTGMVRASFAPYNTMAEARSFIAALDRAINMLS